MKFHYSGQEWNQGDSHCRKRWKIVHCRHEECRCPCLWYPHQKCRFCKICQNNQKEAGTHLVWRHNIGRWKTSYHKRFAKYQLFIIQNCWWRMSFFTLLVEKFKWQVLRSFWINSAITIQNLIRIFCHSLPASNHNRWTVRFWNQPGSK